MSSDPKTAGRWGWNGDVCAVWGEAIVIGGTREEKEARALLFAAAPDLLDALKLAHDYLAGNGWEGDPRMKPITDALEKAEVITYAE